MAHGFTIPQAIVSVSISKEEVLASLQRSVNADIAGVSLAQISYDITGHPGNQTKINAFFSGKGTSNVNWRKENGIRRAYQTGTTSFWTIGK